MMPYLLVRVATEFKEPGLHRVGLNLSTDQGSWPIGHEVYVVDDLPEIGTESNAKAWSWADPSSKVAFAKDADSVAGESSIPPRFGALPRRAMRRTDGLWQKV